MIIEIEFPVRYSFDDYHEAPFYVDFLNSITGKFISLNEIGFESIGSRYVFEFDIGEDDENDIE